MDHMDSMALAKVDNIAPGQTKTLDYTYPANTAGSRPQFACYLLSRTLRGGHEA
jgi:hypothetical protein